MLPLIAEATTAALAVPSHADREALLRLPPTRAAHAAALARHRALFDRLEVAPAPVERPPAGPVRIAFWNVERGKYLAASAALLGRLDAAAYLLCELDLGMARSGQEHTARALAARLGTGYAFAVEFLELGLGDAREQEWHSGEVNQAGLHGAAILGRGLVRPAVIRLETAGDWFDGRRGQRRVGGRIALAATLPIEDGPVTLVSVHLESHGDPVQRAAQMGRLLEAIDAYAPSQPVLIGGDLNTSTISRDWARGSGVKPVLPVARVLDPVPYEPLFEVAAARGYDWRRCNAPGVATERTPEGSTPAPPFGKIDWFLSRGLAASAARTVAAVDADGRVLSDHEVLLVGIAQPPEESPPR